MSGSCEKCWDNPCCCGWDYKGWNIENLDKQIAMLNRVKKFKKLNPDAKFDLFNDLGYNEKFCKFVWNKNN